MVVMPMMRMTVAMLVMMVFMPVHGRHHDTGGLLPYSPLSRRFAQDLA